MVQTKLEKFYEAKASYIKLNTEIKLFIKKDLKTLTWYVRFSFLGVLISRILDLPFTVALFMSFACIFSIIVWLKIIYFIFKYDLSDYNPSKYVKGIVISKYTLGGVGAAVTAFLGASEYCLEKTTGGRMNIPQSVRQIATGESTCSNELRKVYTFWEFQTRLQNLEFRKIHEMGGHIHNDMPHPFFTNSVNRGDNLVSYSDWEEMSKRVDASFTQIDPIITKD